MKGGRQAVEQVCFRRRLPSNEVGPRLFPQQNQTNQLSQDHSGQLWLGPEVCPPLLCPERECFPESLDVGHFLTWRLMKKPAIHSDAFGQPFSRRETVKGVDPASVPQKASSKW